MSYSNCKSLQNLKIINENVLIIEEWKDISGYEGLYQISSFGRVKRLPHTTYSRDGAVKIFSEIIKHQYKNKLGYLSLILFKDGVRKNHKCHQLVGRHFIENPENKKTINHKKGIKDDNRVSELEWATQQEQNIHAIRVLNKKPVRSQLNKKGDLCHNSKKIYCPTLNISFVSGIEAGEILGLNRKDIGRVCNNRIPHLNGLCFRFI